MAAAAAAAAPAGEKRSSKYRGVSWKPRRQQWQASIYHNKVSLHLGLFDDEEDAARRYDEEARELKGTEAVLNFPLWGEKKGRGNRTQEEIATAKEEEEIAATKVAIGVQTSKYIGVCWVKNTASWRVQIFHDDEQLYLGNYHEEVDAAKRFDARRGCSRARPPV